MGDDQPHRAESQDRRRPPRRRRHPRSRGAVPGAKGGLRHRPPRQEEAIRPTQAANPDTSQPITTQSCPLTRSHRRSRQAGQPRRGRDSRQRHAGRPRPRDRLCAPTAAPAPPAPRPAAKSPATDKKLWQPERHRPRPPRRHARPDLASVVASSSARSPATTRRRSTKTVTQARLPHAPSAPASRPATSSTCRILRRRRRQDQVLRRRSRHSPTAPQGAARLRAVRRHHLPRRPQRRQRAPRSPPSDVNVEQPPQLRQDHPHRRRPRNSRPTHRRATP